MLQHLKSVRLGDPRLSLTKTADSLPHLNQKQDKKICLLGKKYSQERSNRKQTNLKQSLNGVGESSSNRDKNGLISSSTKIKIKNRNINDHILHIKTKKNIEDLRFKRRMMKIQQIN